MESKINKYSKQLIIFNSIFILCWLTISIFPFLWTFWGSFKVKADFFSRADWFYAISGFNTLIETGGKFTFEAYINSWIEGEFWRAARNTIIVTVEGDGNGKFDWVDSNGDGSHDSSEVGEFFYDYAQI